MKSFQKEKVVIFFIISILLSPTIFSQKIDNNQLTSLSAREIASKVLPSTVKIITQDEKGETLAQGSGFVYKSGLIATNLHIFNRATQAYIKFVGKDNLYKVEEIVGINRRRDLCVVRVNENQTKPLLIAALSKNEVGDDVFVASNPKGLEGSFSKGIISAIRKNAGLIQIDASISPGSSGGAVLNNRGEVVGIVVSSIITGQNLNFAIPVEYLSGLKLGFKEPTTTAGALAFNDWQRKKLKGFVESIIETQAEFEYKKDTDSYIESSEKPNAEIFFDIYGNILSSFNYYESQLTMKIEQTYDDEGFMRRRITQNDSTPLGIGGKKWNSNDEYSVLESIIYANKQRQFSLEANDGIAKEIYDKQGNLMEFTIYKPNSNQEMRKDVYVYGKYGFIFEQKTYEFEDLKYVTRFTYETDEQGNWVKRISTVMYPKYSSLGFVPDSVNYRKITYFSD